MEIRVTAEDIKNGQVNSPWCCPIAYAVCRALNDDELSIAVGSKYVSLNHSGPDYQMPAQAVKFVSDFDEGLPVFPFTFTLDF